MDIAELGTRLDRLERSNRRLRAIVVGLSVILGFTIVVTLRPAQAEAQGRAVTAQAFLLVDDAGQVRADLAMVDGSPRLAMWQPGGREPVVRLGTEVDGSSYLVMWRPGAEQAAIALRSDKVAGNFVTNFIMGELQSGEIFMSTSTDGRQPTANIFPPGGGTAVWSAP
jgi:hypothetical protein